jgi:hypothetical protein
MSVQPTLLLIADIAGYTRFRSSWSALGRKKACTDFRNVPQA